MIVVDTSVWISHFADVNHPEVRRLRAIDALETVLVGDAILMEVLRGARSEQAARFLESKLRVFGQASMLSTRLAVLAAEHYRHLRGRGVTIRNSVDVIVATFCIEYGHELLHRDRDFDHFEQHLGLRVLR